MRKPERWAAVLLVLAGLAVYSNSLQGPFVLDDVWSIPGNPTLRHLWPPNALLKLVPGGITVSGRPLLNYSFAINHAISGTDVWSYHALNILIHVLAGLVLFGILRRTLKNATLLAFSIALLWLAHPLQTESVTYIVQRAESLASLFCLLALYCFIRGAAPVAGVADPGMPASARPATDIGQSPRLWYCLSFLACLLGVATKEIIVVMPVIILFYDRAFLSGSFAGAWRARKLVHVALFATWIPLALLIVHTGSRQASIGFGTGLSSWSYFLIQIQIVTRYIGLVFWPHPLIFDYGILQARTPWDVIPYAVVLIPLMAATAAGLVGNRKWAFAALCFFSVLSLTSSFLPGNRQTMAEHRMYLPSAAVIALAVIGIDRLLRFGRGHASILLVVFCACGLGAATLARNTDYASELSLYGQALEHRPDDAFAHFGYGTALLQLNRPAEALQHFDAAIKLHFSDKSFHLNRAYALMALNRPNEAVPAFEQAFKLGPVEPKDEEHYGRALSVTGNPAKAIQYLGEACRFEPGNALFRADLGDAYSETGRWPEAKREYETSLSLKPDLDPFRLDASLADALSMTDDFEGAVKRYRAAIGLHPDSPSIRSNLGSALLALNRSAEAIPELRESLRLRPASAKTHDLLGIALASAGRLAEASDQLHEALKIDPSDEDAKEALKELGR